MKRAWMMAGSVDFLLAAPAFADTGRDLVGICRQSASLCSSDFQSDELAAVLKANSCLPADPNAVHGAIVTWLGKHPRSARLEITMAVRRASSAIWPCHK